MSKGRKRLRELGLNFLPRVLKDAWLEAWVNGATPKQALNAMRQHPEYDTYFPGNAIGNTGRYRLDEFDYYDTTVAYENVLASIDVNPRRFRHLFGDLIENEVSVDEFTDRAERAFEFVDSMERSVREYYAATYGIELTRQALVASFIDPGTGRAVLEKQIGISEIGGAAAQQNFDLDVALADRLYRAGVGEQQADEFFASAAEQLPVLGVLAQRHDDPDDDFDLREFSNAMIFGDPEQRRRIRRLLASERSLYSSRTLFRGSEDAVSGLRRR